MEYLWNEESGGVVELYDDCEEYKLFKFCKLYILVLKNKETGELVEGWVDECDFDKVYGSMGYIRGDFPEVPLEEVLKLFKK